MTPDFWRGKKVFLTGHTGFKGSWLALWLKTLGAHVLGYALAPATNPNLYELAGIGDDIDNVIADIRDLDRLEYEIKAFRPDIVLHLAAQSLVPRSYEDPIGTYSTNVMGTAHLLEAVRRTTGIRVVVNVTSDKCYENREWVWPYRESDPMGGYDPYSSSKGCAELVTNAYARSYFNPDRHHQHGVGLASARAGNVIGGGDWAKDRLFPDVMRAFMAGKCACIRNPKAVRPWQHVLEPLGGYLVLAERLWEDGARFAGGWNFGPRSGDMCSVSQVVEFARDEWAGNAGWEDCSDSNAAHEAAFLTLDVSKAHHLLGWEPRWDLRRAVTESVAWYLGHAEKHDMRIVTLRQIESYMGLPYDTNTVARR